MRNEKLIERYGIGIFPAAPSVTTITPRQSFGPGIKFNHVRWPPCRLKFVERNEPDFDFFIQRGCNSLEHRKRVAFVVGIFQPANYRRRCSNKFSEPLLSQTSLFSQGINLARNFIICPLLLNLGDTT